MHHRIIDATVKFNFSKKCGRIRTSQQNVLYYYFLVNNIIDVHTRYKFDS